MGEVVLDFRPVSPKRWAVKLRRESCLVWWCLAPWPLQLFINSPHYAKEKVLACLNMLGCRLRACGMKLWLKCTKYFCFSYIDF